MVYFRRKSEVNIQRLRFFFQANRLVDIGRCLTFEWQARRCVHQLADVDVRLSAHHADLTLEIFFCFLLQFFLGAEGESAGLVIETIGILESLDVLCYVLGN